MLQRRMARGLRVDNGLQMPLLGIEHFLQALWWYWAMGVLVIAFDNLGTSPSCSRS